MNKYEFETFKELATSDGFNYPIDVKYGSIFLGTLIAKPDGYIISLISTPHRNQSINQSQKNKFKSLNLAAEVLHKAWKSFRHGDDSANGNVLVPA